MHQTVLVQSPYAFRRDFKHPHLRKEFDPAEFQHAQKLGARPDGLFRRNFVPHFQNRDMPHHLSQKMRRFHAHLTAAYDDAVSAGKHPSQKHVQRRHHSRSVHAGNGRNRRNRPRGQHHDIRSFLLHEIHTGLGAIPYVDAELRALRLLPGNEIRKLALVGRNGRGIKLAACPVAFFHKRSTSCPASFAVMAA